MMLSAPSRGLWRGASKWLLPRQRSIVPPSSTNWLRWNSTAASTTTAAAETTTAAIIDPPTKLQLRNHFVQCAVPMVGFGFMDQTVMLLAGNAIDCTIGVTFGFSTLTAAAFGQICSDAAGVLSGGTLERLFVFMGLPAAKFTAEQSQLLSVKRVGLAGQLIGVVFGCCLGMVNLLFIDTNRSSTLKLQAMSDEQEFAFEVEASNAVRDDATVLTVRGPDVDGLLASMTAALTARGCSLVELHAARAATATTSPDLAAEIASNKDSSKDNNKEVSLSATIDPAKVLRRSTTATNVILDMATTTTDKSNYINDVFVVVNNGTKEQVPDDELDDLASALLEATFHPINVRSFKAHADQLQEHNQELQKRIQKLERLLQDRQIKIVPRATHQ